MAIKQTDAVLKAWLERAIATGGPYDPAALFMGVFTAIDDHGVNTVIGDLTEGTGDLATRVAVTPWGASHKLSDGRWAADGPPCSFTPADDTESQLVTGWFLASASTAGTLKAWATIAEGVSLANEFRTLTVIPRICVDPSGRWSAEVVYDG